MDRLQRIGRVWNWLPAFRAVAETENMQRAAEMLRLSPSGLSRTVRLLEHGVGGTLFERQGRRVLLNARGQEFLGLLRDAMRLIDDGLRRLDGTEWSGALPLAADGEAAERALLPALHRVMTAHPALTPRVARLGAGKVAARLREGVVDGWIGEDAVADDAVVVEAVGSVGYGVYAAPAHPAFANPPSRIDALHDAVFVSTVGGDRWPSDHPRRVALQVGSVHAALLAAAASQRLVVAADPIAEPYVAGAVVRRLWALPPAPLFVARRRDVAGRSSRMAVVLAELKRPPEA